MAVNHRCATNKYGDSNPPEGIPMRKLSDGKWLHKCPRCEERWLARPSGVDISSFLEDVETLLDIATWK